MIKSFKTKETGALFVGKATKGIPGDVAKRARVKLLILDAAASIEDLRVPPGNHLERLKGKRVGQHSIRVSGQWCLCFKWDEGAEDVEFCDYH